jgi:hypothetical protein
MSLACIPGIYLVYTWYIPRNIPKYVLGYMELAKEARVWKTGDRWR